MQSLLGSLEMISKKSKSSRSDIIYKSILPFELGKFERSRKFFGKKDFSINKGDSLVIVGDENSGKITLGGHIYEEINHHITEGHIIGYKLERVNSRKLKEKINQLEGNIEFRGNNYGQQRRIAMTEIISEMKTKIAENKSDNFDTIVIFDISIISTVMFVRNIQLLDATTVIFMKLKHVTGKEERISRYHNKFIFLEKTDGKGRNEIIYEENDSEFILKIQKEYYRQISKRNAKMLSDSMKLLSKLEKQRYSVKSNSPNHVQVEEIFPKILELDEVLFNKAYAHDIRNLEKIDSLDEKINYKNLLNIITKMSNELHTGSVSNLVVDPVQKPLEGKKIIAEMNKILRGSTNLNRDGFGWVKRLSSERRLTDRKVFTLDDAGEMKISSKERNSFYESSHNISINSSLALIISDNKDTSNHSNKSLRSLSLKISNNFKTRKGRQIGQINAKFYSKNTDLKRTDIVSAIFASSAEMLLKENGYPNLRKLQRSGRIGHVDVNLNRGKNELFGTISISSHLTNDVNTIIGIGLESIERICDTEVEIKIDQRIGLTKKLILVNTAEKYLEYYYNTMDEHGTSIIFYQNLDPKMESRIKHIWKGTDIIIIDCDGKLDAVDMMRVLNLCRPRGTSNYGHFLFIEINNQYEKITEDHPFNYWKNQLKSRTRIVHQSDSAGLRDIIHYSHSDVGEVIKQDTKKGDFIQKLINNTTSSYRLPTEIELFSSNWKNHDYKCLNYELISFIEMSKDVLDPSFFKELEKVDNEIYQNNWGDASHIIKKIIDNLYLSEFDYSSVMTSSDIAGIINTKTSFRNNYYSLDEERGDSIQNKKKILIGGLMKDLHIMCSYLNHGTIHPLNSTDKLKDDVVHGIMSTIKDEKIETNAFEFFMQLIYLETQKQLITFDEEKLSEIRAKIINNYTNMYSPMRSHLLTSDKSYSIYERRLSPLLILNHNQIDFSINEDNKWNPNLEWKISHLKQLSNSPQGPSHKDLLIADLWEILVNENALEKAWGIISISNETWIFSILVELFSHGVIPHPKEKSIQIDSIKMIKKWLNEFPWPIKHLLIIIELFSDSKIYDNYDDSKIEKEVDELKSLYLEKLEKIDYNTNMEVIDQIWIKYVTENKTKQGVEKWFMEIKNNLSHF